VHYHKTARKYQCNFNFNKKTYYLGLFENEIEAAKEYNKKALELGVRNEFINKI